MDLRYRLAVVTRAGTSPGREVAVALSRAGASVLVADPDLAAAEDTAGLVREGRVSAWALQVDPDRDSDLRLLSARARDLGGTDLLVDVGPRAPSRLAEDFLDGLAERRGRQDGTPAAVTVALTGGDFLERSTRGRSDALATAGVRVMAVVGPEDGSGPAAEVPASEVARVVVRLLRAGAAGEVVEVSPG